MSVFTLRHARRFREVLHVLVAHGYGQVLKRLPLPFRLPGGTGGGPRQSTETLARESRRAVEELGPTFVKFGQMLSSRPDLVPDEFVGEFQSLRENVTPVSFSEITSILADELGPADNVFQEFSREPVAAASIAQVHRAVYEGRDVVVKIQRPGVAETIRQDVEIIEFLADLIHAHIDEARTYNLPKMAREFGRAIRWEIDFEREASNVRQFKEGLASFDAVVIPTVIDEVSTKKVLTLTRVDGRRLDNVDDLPVADRRKLALTAVESSLYQIFEMGIFHADPHPGNLMVVGSDKLALLDFGTVGMVDSDMRRDLADMLISIVSKDYDLLTKVVLELGEGLQSSDADASRLQRDLREVVEYNWGESLEGVQFGELLLDVMNLMDRHGLVLPSAYVKLVRAVATAESSGRTIYPDLQIIKAVEPYLSTLLTERFFPSGAFAGGFLRVLRVVEKMSSWPEKLDSLLNRWARDEELTVRFRHAGLEGFQQQLKAIAHKLVAGMVMSALVVGGALIIRVDQPPHLFGYPALGVLSYAVALVLGLWLIWQGRR